MSLKGRSQLAVNASALDLAYDEAEAYIRNAQEQLSRSFHELVCIDYSSPAINPSALPLQRRKSAHELSSSKQRARLPDPGKADEPPRRKRFTRKSRKLSLVERPQIVQFGDGSSSDEELSDRTLQQNVGLSRSTDALSLRPIHPFDERSPQSRAQLPRGPAARRANRRQAQRAASKEAPINNLYANRSMSVRDLNGLDLDFNSQENVTRWASQILAELDSLPSSRLDLTDAGREDSKKRLYEDNLSPLSSSVTRSPAATPPVKRHTVFLSGDEFHDRVLNNNRGLSASEMHLPTVPNPFLQSSMSRLSMSLLAQQTHDSSNDCTPRATPCHRSLETICSEDRSRSETVETLKAEPMLPAGSDQPPKMSERNNNQGRSQLQPTIPIRSYGLSPLRNSKGQDGPFPYETSPSARGKNSLRSPIEEKIARRRNPELVLAQKKEAAMAPSKNADGSAVTYPSIPNMIADWEHKSRGERTNRNDPGVRQYKLAAADARLQNSISELSRRMNTKLKGKQCDVTGTSVQSSATEMAGGHGEKDLLERWKKEAECRFRNSTVVPDRTVNHVISSLIEAAESSRNDTLERPPELSGAENGAQVAQDVSTQTSPFSLSRSSSFDWISSPNETPTNRFPPPKTTPTAPPPTAPITALRTYPAPKSKAEPRSVLAPTDSSEDTDCDAEVQAATRAALGSHQRLDESLALLLQCAGEDIDPSTLMARPPAPRPNQLAPEMLPMTPRRVKTTSITRNSIITSEPAKGTPNGLISMVGMCDSVYDNVPGKRNRRIEETNQLPVPEHEASLSALQQVSEAIGNLTKRSEAREQHLSYGENGEDQQQPECSAEYRIKMSRLEEEARDCCDWLRLAGFAYYARLFQENKFPIDLKNLYADSQQLDSETLLALTKRLVTLNRTAIMRMDRVVLRPRNSARDDSSFYDDEHNRWQHRHSNNINRCNEPIYGVGRNLVSTRPDHRAEEAARSPKNETDVPQPAREGRGLQRSQSERIKERARAFMKKIDIRSSSRRRPGRDAGELVIGDPVLVSFDSASPESTRMFQNAMHAGASTPRVDYGGRLGGSRDVRRQGFVLTSPQSYDPPQHGQVSSVTLPSRSRREQSVPPPRLPDYPGFYELSPRGGAGRYDYLTQSESRARSLARRDEPHPLSSSSSSRPPAAFHTFSPPSLHPDGYFVHDDVDAMASPYSSLQRRTPAPNTASLTRPPPTKSAQLHVVRTGEIKMSQSSLDAATDSEEHSAQSAQSAHQRRDSGVGSSLSRSPSGPSAQRVRASVLVPAAPFLIAHNNNQAPTAHHNPNNSSSGCGSWTSASSGASRSRPPGYVAPLSSSVASSLSNKEEDVFFSDQDLPRTIDALSIVDLTRNRKLAFFRITAMLERYMGQGAVKLGSPNGNSAAVKNWALQKLRKFRGVDENNEVAFGVPLEYVYKKTGYCLPRSIFELMRFLRSMSAETVGIFRKNGVRSRILEMRETADLFTEKDVFAGDNRLVAAQVHDAADLLKQYFRDLPEPLMTTRNSEISIHIYQNVPESERIRAMQHAMLLLPDENREALQTLLFFLHDVARHSDTNNMNAQNLAVCFTPSLFQLSASRLNQVQTGRRHRTVGGSGLPSEKEMKEQSAAQACLTEMITDCRRLFMLPEWCTVESNGFEEEFPNLNHLGGCGYRSYLVRKMSDLIKEHQERWKGYANEWSSDGVDVSSKKSNDSHPLRFVRAVTEIDGPPREILHRIMKERPVWDNATINWRHIDTLQSDTDIFQHVQSDAVGHPTRDYHVVRMHKLDIKDTRGSCALVERSIHCPEVHLLGGLRAVVLDNRVFIEPHHGRSRVTMLQRIDMRGRGSQWYSRIYPAVVGRQLARLRDSFLKFPDEGPETKV